MAIGVSDDDGTVPLHLTYPDADMITALDFSRF